LLDRLEEWTAQNDARFSPGHWYFHGRLAGGG
jgi:hypothetical protein